jgi:hypothetical protein
MPNVFLEAWAAGIPVISLHFDPDQRIADEGHLSRRLRDELSRRAKVTDPELRRQLGDRGREYVARVHSPRPSESDGGRAARGAGLTPNP